MAIVLPLIRNDDDLTAVIKRIKTLWGSPLGTPEGDELDALATLVETYESRRYPAMPSDPVDILRYAVEEMGRSQAELTELLGSRSRASEILNRKRHMSLSQIRAISAAWHLPIALLAAPYKLERASA